MNKKLNTFLFVVVATILNIFIMAIIFIIGLILIGKIAQFTSDFIFQLLLIPVLFLSIFATTFIHHQIIKLLSKKINMDKYFTPLFNNKKFKPDNLKKNN